MLFVAIGIIANALIAIDAEADALWLAAALEEVNLQPIAVEILDDRVIQDGVIWLILSAWKHFGLKLPHFCIQVGGLFLICFFNAH